jgi:tetratricopeptide (TPR) repeat protein
MAIPNSGSRDDQSGSDADATYPGVEAGGISADRDRPDARDDQTVLRLPTEGDTRVDLIEPPVASAGGREADVTGAGTHTVVPGGPGEGPLAPGHAFGARYHIISVIGVGGMGAVYRAWDQELGVLVALKVIRPEVAADPEAARALEGRFKQELLLARKVTHRNVVRIHDLGRVEGIKYITMPFIEGEDLSAILKREGSLPVPRVMPIARTMVSGLVAAHRAGIVHRDLKPANIMVDTEGQALIMDFGVAREEAPAASTTALADGVPAVMRAAAMAGHTVAGSVVGTIDYMAPEQALAQKVDQRADIYAVGLILYDLLLGRKRSEHADSAIAELQQRMRHAPPPPRAINPTIPPALDAVISRCLHPNPAARFQTTVELETALNRLDDKGKPLPVMRRLTRRMVAATVLLVALLVAGAFYIAQRLSAPVKPHDPVSVIIADFRNTTKDPAFDRTLEPMVRRALEGAAFITAYDRGRVRPVFRVKPPEKLDEIAARELAVRQGLGVVLSGSIGPLDNGYEIQVKATETVTGNVIAAVSSRASAKDEVLATATRLATTIRQALGDETSESAQLFAMKSLSTTSLEVVGYYATAIEDQSQGKYEEARQSFLKAVARDPNFGLGYSGLAVMSLNLGQPKEAEKYISQALRHLDGMTDRERLNTRGFYYRMTGDYQQCAKEYSELTVRFAADTVAYNQLANCLSKLRNMRGAVDAMQRAVQILPRHAVYRANLALLSAYAGDFEAAERQVRTIPQPDARAVIALAFSQVGQGLFTEATQTYQKLGSMGALGASFAASGLGDLALYQGRFSEATRIFEEGAASDEKAGNVDAAARKLTNIAYAHLLRGQPRDALVAARKALENSKAVDVRFRAGRVLVEAGDASGARVVAKDLGSELTAEPQAYGKVLEGAIALETGDPRQAIRIFNDANSILDTWLGHFDLGRAYLLAEALPQADSEFDRCLQRRGEALSLFDEDATYGYFPAVYYYQGRVREALKTAAYADSYREYLKIRGESREDVLLPEVRQRAGG